MNHPDVSALIPERDLAHKTLAEKKSRRTALIYMALALAGGFLSLTQQGFIQPFSLGWVFPGAGFALFFESDILSILLYGGLIILTLLLFAVSLFLWFASGNILAPILVWLGSAAVAGAMHPKVTTASAAVVITPLALAGVIWLWMSVNKQQRLALQTRDRRNRYLQEYNESLSVRVDNPSQTSDDDTAETLFEGELPEDSLGLYRYLLDRSLQPVSDYDGFNVVDQFQTAALRYQVCGVGYALALVQNSSTPAFTGYLSDAQLNLHEKMTDHKNWGYWFWENTWGNLNPDPNPVGKDNIMYTGWVGALLGEYMLNTGDMRWIDQPLVLKHPRKAFEYRYTFGDLAENIYQNMKRTDFCLYPCEPNWIYTMCNNYGAVTLKLADQILGTRYWERIEADYRHHMEEDFTTVDGRAIGIRSSRTGLTIPSLTSVMADAMTAQYLVGVLPDMARRGWEILKHDYLSITDDNLELELRGWDNIDTGTYKPSTISAYAGVGAAAAEFGDAEVLAAVRKQVEKDFTYVSKDGVTHLEGVSCQAHIPVFLMYGGQPGSRRSLHNKPVDENSLSWPKLISAPYPQVIVAYAKNQADGLTLVLYPGVDGAVEQQTLTLGQLQLGQTYCCEGADVASITADGIGQATLTVNHLSDRKVIKIIAMNE